jgi:hypothetical protein
LAQAIPNKVSYALSDAAKLNGIEPRYLDSSKGILLGWSREFRTEAVITLDPDKGLRVWYHHSLGRCKICSDKRECKSALLKTAQTLGVPFTKQEAGLLPSKLSSLIFSRAMSTSSYGSSIGAKQRQIL